MGSGNRTRFRAALSLSSLLVIVGFVTRSGEPVLSLMAFPDTPEEVVTVHLPGDVEMVFRLIPSGTFLMGSPESEEGRDNDEGPQHQVTISKPFYLDIYEVTHAQWQAVTGSIRNYAGFDGSNYDSPMETTSWNECQEFISKLNSLSVGTFRLPTEAEWEYACRAGTTSRFYWGTDPDYADIDSYAWYDENADGEAHDVGEKKPNPWGLFDMAGNVYEWCQDWYGPYSADAQTDPTGPKAGTAKVFRGGEWFNPAENCRSAFRGQFSPKDRLYFGGLRLVLEVAE